MYYFDTKINVGGVSVNGGRGGRDSGRPGQYAPGVLLLPRILCL